MSATQRVEGGLAVQFFGLSGLHIDVLRQIWNLASVQRQPFLTQYEFYLYLKYISLAQANSLGDNPY